jgi:hypothetical protein
LGGLDGATLAVHAVLLEITMMMMIITVINMTMPSTDDIDNHIYYQA